jgi:branched-chain amino acid transport system substrate-binding protein
MARPRPAGRGRPAPRRRLSRTVVLNMNPIRSLIVAVGAALACTGAPAQQQPLRVGLELPLSGGSSDFGKSARFGAELAIKEINEAGGFLGRPFALVELDDRSVPDVGRQNAEELVHKVDFTVGYCNTGVALKAIEVFQKAHQVLMVPCATGTEITHRYPAKDSFIFRVAPTDTIMARFLAREIVERRKIHKIAVLADSTGYGEGGLTDIRAELAHYNVTPVFVARFPLGVTSLVDTMRQARDAGAEAIVAFTVGPEHAVAVRSRAEIGWKAPYFSPWPLSFRSVLDRAGPAALEGTMMVQTIIHDLANERRLTFLARYYAFSNDRPIGSLMAAAQTYDAMYLMLRALFATHGDASGAALKHALETMESNEPGVVTTYVHPFSAEDHDAFSANMVWLGVWRGGEIHYVYEQDAMRSSILRRKEESR